MSKEKEAGSNLPVTSILIVEDNPVNMKLAQILIKNEYPDLVILEASNGEEAVRMYAEHKPVLILMDIQMPVMDGFEATRAIREQEKQSGAKVAIVALTASIVKDEYAECLRAGMDDFLSKPFVKDLLFSTVRKWVYTNN